MAKTRHLEHSDHWETPPQLFADLNSEFDFDFDPCPLFADFDGLAIDWGQRNYVNPPYERFMKEAFVKKAIIEANKGKLCVCLLPVSTSTNLFHKYIQPNAKEIRFLKGRVRFRGVNTRGETVSEATPRVSAMHDSMIVIFGEHNG